MKSIKNGDVVTFGDKIFLAAEGQLAMVETVTKKELKANMDDIKKVLKKLYVDADICFLDITYSDFHNYMTDLLIQLY